MRPTLLRTAVALLFASLALAPPAPGQGGTPAWYVRKGTWQETMRLSLEALRQAREAEERSSAKPFTTGVMRGGDPPQHVRVSIAGWSDLYLIVGDDGNYQNDVANWADAKVVARDGREVFLDTVDPVSATQQWGSFRRDNKSAIGGPMQVADRVFPRGIGTHAVSAIHYALKGERAIAPECAWFEAWVGVDVSRGKGVGSITFTVSPTDAPAGGARKEELWGLVARDFPGAEARRQMEWEKSDRIWDADAPGIAQLAAGYAAAARGALAPKAAELAKAAPDPAALARLREVYHRSRAIDEAVAQLRAFRLDALGLAIRDLASHNGARYPGGRLYLERLERLERRRTDLLAGADRATDDAPLVAALGDMVALRREALLANPLLDFDRLLLVRRRADNLGLPANWQSNSSIGKTGYDNEIATLSPVAPGGKLTTLYRPEGGKFVGDVDLHFGAGRMLFSSIGDGGRWQVFEIGTDGKGLRQVSRGDQPDVDNYDACYLPNGRILFNSTACFVGVPCVYGSDHVTNLYGMDADGGNVRQLSVDQDHDWCPTVLNNGRVMYLRWEYADTPHSQTRLLFHMNPDGTEQMEYYGSNSYWPNGVFYARPVPGDPSKVVGIVTGHHGVRRMGELVLFDPARSRRDADGALQRIPGHGKRVEAKVADALVDGSWPKFLHPYPLSDRYFLVSCQPTPESHWGIYLVDVFDNILLLAEEPGYALLEPIPLRATPRPPVLPDRVDWKRQDATVTITDIYRGGGLRGVPRGTVKRLRLYAYHYAYQGMGGLLGVIGMDGPWDIKRVLGTVPVEADGSAHFRVPALTPISLQPLDEEGKALQVMRSWMTAMPGERVSCVGCHEPQDSSPPARQSLAAAHAPAEIRPWYGPARGFSFPREVQPVLDRYCVGCHDGAARADGSRPPDLRGSVKLSDFRMVTPGNGGNDGKFSVGYANLHRFVRHPGIESDYHLLPPKEFHADTTHLVQMLQRGHYGVKLDPESWDRLVTWIDLNTPYHGTWHEEIADPGPQRERRRALKKLYAGIDEDPEAVPDPSQIADCRLQIGGTLAAQPRAAAAGKPASPLLLVNGAGGSRPANLQSAISNLRSVDLGSGVRLELVRVPAGEFLMGDGGGYADEQPQTRVRIERPFWIGRCEVSNAQYARFDPAHDSHVEDKLAYQFGVHGYPVNEPEQPVVRVSWQRAMAFCRWLSKRTGLAFTLPTEAQWEYACRAGSDAPLFFGAPDADFSRYANVADAKLSEFASNPYTVFEPLANASDYDCYIPRDTRFNDGGLVTRAVGSYQPNAWGLCDVHGNAAEWTRSDYRPYPYDAGDGRDRGDAAGRKVVRGGSWRDRPRDCRSAVRLAYPAWQRVYNVGFRVMCPAGAEPAATARK